MSTILYAFTSNLMEEAEMKKKNIAIIIVAVAFSFYCNAENINQQYGTMRKRIIIYNLINGLYLTREQMRFILSKAKEVDSLREELKEKMEVRKKEQLSLLVKLEDEVKKEIPQPSYGLARKIHHNNIYARKLHREYIEILDRAVQEIKLCLTPTQIYNIKAFKPCLVPPEGAARIGQSEEDKGLVRLLERIREMPQYRYMNKKDKIIERFVERIYLKYPRTEQEKIVKKVPALRNIMDEVRSLSNEDFALQKKDLAKKIKDLIGGDKEREVDVNKRIERFLLDSQTIYVLEDKLSSPSNS